MEDADAKPTKRQKQNLLLSTLHICCALPLLPKHNELNLALACRRTMEDADEGYQEAEAALEIMEEAEAEEAELKEVQDLLDYYLQRATTQLEVEHLLAGSRDLEESIGVSWSARRFEVSSAGFVASQKA